MSTKTKWHLPSEFPRLDAAAAISLDIETKDPKLTTHGPGTQRGDGFIAGIAVGVPTGERWYFPMRHERGPNLAPNAVLAWARDELCRERQPKVGTNLLYDLEWLHHEGVPVNGRMLDIACAEPLIDENKFQYNLDSIAQTHLGETKVDEELYAWCAEAFGGQPTKRAQAGNIWRAPADVVGPYAEGDVDLPLRIWNKQRKLLERDNVKDLFELEIALIPLLLAMRLRGVRVDLERAEEVRAIMHRKQQDAQDRLNTIAGFEVGLWKVDHLERLFTDAGVRFGRTPKTKKGSFTKDWLAAQSHPAARALYDARRYDKAIGTFIDGHVYNHQWNGRVHCLFHPLRSDDGGTVSGRFSSSKPNLQNIPSRDPELGPLVRSIFCGERGEGWRRYDYSQIEYRLLAHYAIGEGSKDVRAQFNRDPTTDFHEMVRQLIYKVTGNLIDRKPTKNINFGLCYGMGKPKLVRNLGLTESEGDELFHAYHTGAPFVKATYDRCAKVAADDGYIKTLLGRRRRFNKYEPFRWGKNEDRIALPRAEAEEKWGYGIRRAYTHKALNSLLQGGAADLLKKAMLDLWKSGVFDVVGVPLVTVHDELGFSDSGSPESEEAFQEVQRIMENAVPLRVPVLCEGEAGPNWGEVK